MKGHRKFWTLIESIWTFYSTWKLCKRTHKCFYDFDWTLHGTKIEGTRERTQEILGFRLKHILN